MLEDLSNLSNDAHSVAGFSPPASDNDDFSAGQGLVETFCAEGKCEEHLLFLLGRLELNIVQCPLASSASSSGTMAEVP